MAALRKATRPTTPEPLEKDIQKAILSALALHPRVKRVYRSNTGSGQFWNAKTQKPSRFLRFGFPGQTDISGIAIDGRVIAVEVKRPSTRGDLSQEQKDWIADVKSVGGYAGVATSVEEAFSILDDKYEQN